ncbi:hypothetical protein [Dyella ginsengisoli]|uniref:hypothetical protein n=1 Tax=Dyella ginsengisoli TaxID=363848 RepID=UPI000347FC5C|nr:hypothetical protein [Dyella ginsengisoli]
MATKQPKGSAAPAANDATQGGKKPTPELVIRGSRRNESVEGGWETTVLLFNPQPGNDRPNFLTGFVVAGGEKTQVIAHINERKPDTATGEVKANFIVLSELVSREGEEELWQELGHGNAVNRRSDGKKVYFDELLFKVEGEVLSARAVAKVSKSLHHHLGFEHPREKRPERGTSNAPAPADSEPAPAARKPARSAQRARA